MKYTYNEVLILLQHFFDEKGEKGKAIHCDLDGCYGLYLLPGGIVYSKTDLDLDTDGAKIPGVRWDKTHQGETSLRDSAGRSVDSNNRSFVVLPGGWGKQFNLKIGDLGVVLYNNRIVPVTIADVGPSTKIGEGSIALHRALGHETVVGGKIRDVGIDGEVRTIWFPNSGLSYLMAEQRVEDGVSNRINAMKVLAGD